MVDYWLKFNKSIPSLNNNLEPNSQNVHVLHVNVIWKGFSVLQKCYLVLSHWTKTY